MIALITIAFLLTISLSVLVFNKTLAIVSSQNVHSMVIDSIRTTVGDSEVILQQQFVPLVNQLKELESAIKLQKSDSARLIEWLDKRDIEILKFSDQLKQTLDIKEREVRLEEKQTKILELAKDVRMFISRK